MAHLIAKRLGGWRSHKLERALRHHPTSARGLTAAHPFPSETGGPPAILEEVKKKYPDLSQASAQVEIKKAFGSDEAVKFLLQMSQGMEALGGNIRSIEQAMKSGTAVTEEMARAMNLDIGSQFQLVRQQVSNLFEILGRTLLPVVTPVIQGVSRMILFP